MNELIITRWQNLVDPVGTPWSLSWPELTGWLAQRREYLGDKEHPGWSPAEFTPCRRGRDNVRRVFALCLDYDQGETIDGVRERLEEFCGLLHTTRKHTPDAPRFRVVLPLARPVSPFEYQALWVRFAAFAGNVDQAPKDPSRFWFVPGCAPDAEFVAEELTGAILDPDEWLAKPEPRQSATVVSFTERRGARQVDVEERAIRYIAKMQPAIAGQGGHKATWDVAVMLAKGFGLSEDATFRILWTEYNPRCEPPWSEKELRHKARDAGRARLPDGFLLDTTLDWHPSNSVPMPPPSIDDDGPWEYPELDDQPQSSSGADERIEREKPNSAVERYGVVSLRQMFYEAYEVLKRGPENDDRLTTGVLALDKLIGGWRRGHVTILGAGTSWGKTTFSIMTTDVNELAGAPILYIAGEDERLMYAKRFLARRGKLNAMRLRDNDVDKSDLATVIDIASRASDRPIFLNGIGKPVELLCKAIRELSRELGIKFVVADYVQRFKTERRLQDRRTSVTYIAERLSDEIKLAGASGLVLSQLKRIEGRKPTMDDLKESGDLENMAEHVLLGYREKDQGRPWEDANDERFNRMLIVAKNKDGPIPSMDIEIPFDEVSASFKSDSEGREAFEPLEWT